MKLIKLHSREGREEFKKLVDDIHVELIGCKLYGEEDKLKKPKTLKTTKQAWSTKIIGRSASFFEMGDEIFIKMGELFCPLMGFPEPKDMELPLSALRAKYPDRFMKIGSRDRFIYADGWCRIMELNTGWIRIDGLLRAVGGDFCYVRIAPIVQKLFEELCSLSAQKEKFLTLNGYDEDSMAYYRFCQRIVEHYYTVNNEMSFRNRE